MPTPRANYGISRIDQPERNNHGFYVRIMHEGCNTQKFFPDKSLGGKKKALQAARAFRDALLATMPIKKQEAAARRARKIRHSGVVGVTHVITRTDNKKQIYEYWQATWRDLDGRRRAAKFSITRYGDSVALEMAKQARENNSGEAK